MGLLYTHSMDLLFTVATIFLCSVHKEADGLRCYACVGTQPGCGAEELEWRLIKNMECPDVHDLCLKITDKISGSNMTTRGCLSMLISIRRDIPGDHYEGCRPAAHDVRLNKDVLVTHPHQQVVQRTESEFCFCGFDNYCNVASTTKNIYIARIFIIVSIFQRILT